VSQIQQKISGLGTGVGDTNPLDALAKSGQGDALKALQLQASTLPAPIGAIVAQVGGRSESLAVGQARGELDQRYREQVIKPCLEIVSGRYPIQREHHERRSAGGLWPAIRRRGIFDVFFKQNLAPLVDTSRNPWVWRSGGSGPAGASTAMLQQFEAVEKIRQNFLG